MSNELLICARTNFCRTVYREVRQKKINLLLKEIPPVISKYHFMAFKEILEFRVQIIRKYIMVVNVPLHCSVASPPFPYNKPGSLTNYMRRW